MVLLSKIALAGAHAFWGAEGLIQPGKEVGFTFATEEKGARMK